MSFAQSMLQILLLCIELHCCQDLFITKGILQTVAQSKLSCTQQPSDSGLSLQRLLSSQIAYKDFKLLL